MIKNCMFLLKIKQQQQQKILKKNIMHERVKFDQFQAFYWLYCKCTKCFVNVLNERTFEASKTKLVSCLNYFLHIIYSKIIQMYIHT